MTILDAIKDENLFRPFFGDLSSWGNWQVALGAVYGTTPMPRIAESVPGLIKACSGRSAAKLSSTGFPTALFLTGRRSGKSRMAAVIGAYEAILAGNEERLCKGETGVVAVAAPSKRQAAIVHQYMRGIFEAAPMLAKEVVRDQAGGFELANGNRIEILAGDFRLVRGFTLLAVVLDEVAFFGVDEEGKIKSDTELVRAVQPGLATSRGKLIAITTPYARKGWTYQTYQRHFGNDAGRTLVWKSPSRTMNPTLPQSVVDEALAEDLQAARSEYLGEFRDDVSAFMERTLVERLVVEGRTELAPRTGPRYFAFADVSGGRSDDAALAVGHREGRTVVMDVLRRYRPPFSPQEVIALMAQEVKRFGLRRVTGDNYAAEFVARAFEACGINYLKCEKTKSALYAELLPRMCSAEIELPDDALLVNQLCGLERRTRSGGKDIIDHAPGGHDDLANAAAGIAFVASGRVFVSGRPMLGAL
jgi:hypothetical protein